MAIINTISGSGIPLTTQIPLLLNKWSTGERWAHFPTNINNSSSSPSLYITNWNNKEAYLTCGYGTDEEDRPSYFIPLVDFSIDIYMSDSPYGYPTITNISPEQNFIFKKYQPYGIELPQKYESGQGQHTVARIYHYNGTGWDTVWENRPDTTGLYIIYEARASTNSQLISTIFYAHILSPLVPLQPNYDL